MFKVSSLPRTGFPLRLAKASGPPRTRRLLSQNLTVLSSLFRLCIVFKCRPVPLVPVVSGPVLATTFGIISSAKSVVNTLFSLF